MLEIIQIFMSFIGAFAFAALFNLRGKRLLFAGLGGLLCGVVFYICAAFSQREILCYFVTTAAVAVYAEIAARLLKSPATGFLSPGIIPLVPGGKMYFTMSAALHGNLDSFFEQGMETVYIALAIAAGILVVSPVKRVAAELIRVVKEKIRGC